MEKETFNQRTRAIVLIIALLSWGVVLFFALSCSNSRKVIENELTTYEKSGIEENMPTFVFVEFKTDREAKRVQRRLFKATGSEPELLGNFLVLLECHIEAENRFNRSYIRERYRNQLDGQLK